MAIQQTTAPYLVLFAVSLGCALAWTVLFITLVAFKNSCCQSRDPSRPCSRTAMALWTLLGIVTTGLLLSFAFFVKPDSFPRTYRTRQLQAPYANMTLQCEGKRTGVTVGSVVNSGTACDSHLATQELTSITPSDWLLWRQLAVGESYSKYDFSEADGLVDAAIGQGIEVRGHALIWDSEPDSMPGSLAKAITSEVSARLMMRKHIDAVMTHFASRIDVWDVVHDPLGPKHWSKHNPFHHFLGGDYVANALTYARAAAPNATLFINQVLASFSKDDAKVIALLSLVEQLVVDGVPLQGIGLTSYGDLHGVLLEDVQWLLQRVSQLGLQVEITGLDIRLDLFSDNSDPYEAQGRYLADWIRACVQVPGCRGVTMAGLSDATAWYDTQLVFRWMRPNEPVIFDLSGYRKPGYYQIMDTLRGLPDNFRTHATRGALATAAQGLEGDCDRDLVHSREQPASSAAALNLFTCPRRLSVAKQGSYFTALFASFSVFVLLWVIASLTCYCQRIYIGKHDYRYKLLNPT